MSPLRVGDLLEGYAVSTWFGCHVGESPAVRVEAVGADWVVARDEDGDVWICTGAQFNPEILTDLRAGGRT
jgi:hypothetical protein